MLEKFEKFEIENKKKNAICGGSSGIAGANAAVRIRGVNSLGNNTPLYIVDGIQTING